MRPPVPRTVVHYASHDPRSTQGGVESFAHNLKLMFDQVIFMTPSTRDEERVRREGLPVICDNHMVLDWPEDLAVIGFQHGVAWRKVRVTRSTHDLGLAVRQLQATRRRNVLWIACARWIADTFNAYSRCSSRRVIYHAVDLERFDGKLTNDGSRLLLHDARSSHKGKSIVEALQRRLPSYRVEPLACSRDEVADRMRRAAGFLHLSRYEGNSIVCNEAMAMNLPCLFTRVGLMLDPGGAPDVKVIDPHDAFSSPARLQRAVVDLLEESSKRAFRPRDWVAQNASIGTTRAGWAAAMVDFDALRGTKFPP